MIRLYDMCAGIGGFRLGAQLAGIDVRCVGTCEIDRWARLTYEAMFTPPGESWLSDVRELDRDTRRIERAVPDMDLLCAGFPCQPHSLMGNRAGANDERGMLFFDIARVVEVKRPTWVVLENVRALRSVNDGALFADILNTLTALGYGVRVHQLDAALLGVPQRRRRIFIVGTLTEDSLQDVRPVVDTVYPTAWHLLEREVDERYYLSDRILRTILTSQHKGYARPAEINQLTARPLTRTMHKMHRASQDNYYSDDFIHGRFDASREMVILDAARPARIRRITPREAFRLQGFPELLIDRALGTGVSNTQLYMQTGNAVPPPMAAAVLAATVKTRPPSAEDARHAVRVTRGATPRPVPAV